MTEDTDKLYSEPPHRADLLDLFGSVQRGLTEALTAARARHRNSSSKGASVEDAVRDALRDFLPRSLSIGHGEILDTNGGRSHQTDIIIATDEHPATFGDSTPGTFLIECVAAAGEVKSVLTTAELAKSLDAAAAFRKLRAFMMPGTDLRYTGSDLKRYSGCPPYFLIAVESKIPIQSIVETIENRPGPSFDAVFTIDRGLAIDYGDGQGAFKAAMPDGLATGWGYWEKPSGAMATFIAWLSIAMRRARHPGPVLPLYLVSFR